MESTPSRADPTPPGALSRGSRRSTLLATSVGLLGLALLLLQIGRYPPEGLATVDLARFSLPDASKLAAMLRSLAWLGAINLSALALGALFVRGLPMPPALARLRVLYQAGFGLALLGLGVLLLAALHLLHAEGFAALLLAPPVLWVLLSWRGLRAGAWRQRTGRPSRAALWSSAAYGLLLVGAFIHAFGPDVGWDALTYHLAFPERYLFENGISMTPFSHLSGYVGVIQMLYALALFLDGQSLAVLVHFEFGVLTLAALWRLGASHSRRAAFLAPLFLIADPLFQTELGWAYSDLGLAFYSTLAAIALCTFVQQRDGRDADGRLVVYAGIACGLCCATRYLGVTVAIALCAITWLPPRHTRVRENLRACFALAGMSALVMLPWMVRNAAFTGNPVTPLLQSLFHAPGDEYIPAIVVQQSADFLRSVGMGRELTSLLALPWNLAMSSKPGLYENSFGYVISALHLVGLLALVGWAACGKRLRAVALLVPLLEFACAFVLLWFFSFQEARFLLPILPLVAYAGAVAIDGLVVASPAGGRWLLVLPLLAMVHTQLARLPSLAENFEFALGKARVSRGEDRGVEAAAAFVRETLAPGDKIFLWMEQRGYLFRGVQYVPYHIGSGSPALALVHRSPDHRALYCELRALGITHVAVNRMAEKLVLPGLLNSEYFIDDLLADRSRFDRMLEASARLLYARGEFEVHQLEGRPCGPDSSR